MDLRFPDGTSDAYAGTGGGVKSNATEDDLIDALSALENEEIEYLILQDPQTKLFMQVAGNGSGSYVLEHNEPNDDAMQHAKGDIDGTQITDALTAFLNYDPTWRTMFQWERITY